MVGNKVVGSRVGNLVGEILCVGVRDGCELGETEGAWVGVSEASKEGAGEGPGLAVGVDDGLSVGKAVGVTVGRLVGDLDGTSVGEREGIPEGKREGCVEGSADGALVGVAVGWFVGRSDGRSDGDWDGDVVVALGEPVGAIQSTGNPLHRLLPFASDVIPLHSNPLLIMLLQPELSPLVVTAPEPSNIAGPKYAARLPPNTLRTKLVVVMAPENTAPPPPFVASLSKKVDPLIMAGP
mmetsp:Transcript_2010/g.3556  ORF Transcript_2010/g.3556 Transcript_2010/m.3556 type:complete len:238 (+) Transcript_2010:282-995(+)